MQVALDPAALGVSARGDPGHGLAQLLRLLAQVVECGLQRGVEPGVVQREDA